MPSKYSKKRIKKAGNDLAAGLLNADERQEALDMVGYWRAAHIEPLHRTLNMLESICMQDSSTIIVSRLKRIETTINKLNRPGHQFVLTTLRDIAGCRLIVRDDDEVRRVSELIHAENPERPLLDYVANPKETGYRGIHVICRYDSPSYGYNSLDVEVQVRFLCQHAWATAVEMYDLATGANLKLGSGSEDQRRYFYLAAALINHDIEDEVSYVKELKKLDVKLDVLNILQEASNSMYVTYSGSNISRSDSCLITVDLSVQQIGLVVYPQMREQEAAERYTELESHTEDGLVYLLARAGSLDALRRAYPNYYSNISDFVDWLGNCID